jgi:hypothetical protein
MAFFLAMGLISDPEDECLSRIWLSNEFTKSVWLVDSFLIIIEI